MEEKSKKSSEQKLVEKLKRTTNRIQKSRKNLKLAEKEAAEFEEIHKLLEEDVFLEPHTKTSKELRSDNISSIPLKFPGVKVFHDELVFSLFRENNCDLKSFLENEENCHVFGRREPVPTEEFFRYLVSSQITEVLLPEERNSSTVCLYVLHLLSVHQEPDFVRACVEFLKQQVFSISPEHVFPIITNFGSKRGELFEFCEETFVKKFKRNDGGEKIMEQATFPFFNMEMVGQILLHCIVRNSIVINAATKQLIRGLAKATLDSNVYSAPLLPLYSTLVSALCKKTLEHFNLDEIIDCLHFQDEHLLNQLEICRLLSKTIVPAVQEGLVLRIVSHILGLKGSFLRPPIKINHLKSLLKKLKTKELPPLELFCILQLLNGSLPGLTATLKDSTDIKSTLVSLEKKISKTEDSVDLIRLKLEAVKVGLSFFILPLGFGCKRYEFFKKQIRKFGGTVVGKGAASHVIVEDSVSETCAPALEREGLEGGEGVKYLRVSWVSECLKRGGLTDAAPFEVGLVRKETQREVQEEEEDSPKRMKIESEKYICSKPSSSSQNEKSEMKKMIIDELEKLAEAFRVRKDIWRSHGYRKAINAISLYEKDISTFQEAQSIPGIGEKMALKIMEIIELGKLKKVDEVVDEKVKVMDVFCKIHGVGPSTAEGWYIQGFRTLEELKGRAKLTRQQEIGLKLYGDLLERIPRKEVEEIAEIVIQEAREVDESLSVELVGSFRRGKSSCGDVDLMIVNPGTKTPSQILIQLTEALKAKGYVTDDLVTLEDSENSDKENNHKKYLGVFKLPGENQTHRRIDFFVVPKSEYASALMHYTGSALFNRFIRLLAAKKRMSLTEHGLFSAVIRKSSEVMNKGQLIPTPTEEDIFRHLGLPYRTPAERDH